ncbi:MAG: SNF2-related protein, partial [Chloroflexi bacterium]|nr:SNF2-related protein [Chloroflexota bacterium]
MAKRLARLLQPSAGILASASGPLAWHRILFPYQLDGIRALLSQDALLLADDMGLGKTVQAIAALRIMALQRRIDVVLVVVRAGLLAQWRREIRDWAPELRVSTVHGPASERAYQWSAPAHIYLTSYETLRSDFTENTASPPRRRTWDVVVLDEAQQIKNPSAEVSRKCKLLARRRAWAMTGTPLENCLDDLASVLQFVSPLEQGKTPTVFRSDAEMLARHRELQLRRKKVDVLKDLPPKMVSRIILTLSGSQLASYTGAEEQGVIGLRSMGSEVRVENVLELILRLKQICNFCPATGQSAKLDDIRERLAILVGRGHRSLIFSQFTDDRFGVSAIVSQLQEFCPIGYTGALSLAEKESVLEAFKTDA